MIGVVDRDVLLSPEPLAAHARALLVAEILTTYAEVQWLMRTTDVRGVVGRLRPPTVRPRDDAGERWVARRLAGPVRRVLTPLPWDSRCLMRSLVLLRLLARRGVACELVIGVMPGEAFSAHAWIEHSGRPLLPVLDHQPLARF